MYQLSRVPVTVLCIMIVLFAASCGTEQIPAKITQHTDVSYITGVALWQDNVYCATKGGLLKWNISESTYTVYTTEDGLPSNVLSDIVVDGDGLLWMSSDSGVTSFDGDYFNTYNASNGLPDNNVVDLAIDNKGTLWLATGKGAASRNGNRFSLFDEEGGPGDLSIMTIYFDQGDNIWIGTDGQGIYYHIDGEWGHAMSREGLPTNSISSIVQAWDRSVWSSSWAGITRFDGSGWKIFSSMRKMGTYDARTMLSTERRLWYFTDNGVHASQGGEWFHFTEDEGLISNDVISGYAVSDSEVYVGTVDGLSVIKDGKIENYFVPSSPEGHNCISVETDSRGRIWLGTWETGLNLYDSGFWTTILGRESEALETVRSVVFGGEGEYVFNTTNGVVFEKGSDWMVQTRRDGISANDVRCGVYDDKGRYWAGTAAGVCFRDERGRWKRFRSIHGLPSEDVWACAKSNDGTVWFGTASGIVAFSGDELIDYTPEVGLDEVDVRAVAVDGDRILFGTNDGKLIERKDDAWDVYGQTYLNTDAPIYAIEIGQEGRLWVGTNGDGLIAPDDGYHFTIEDGLPSDYVKDVTINNGIVWVACYGGAASIELPPDDVAGK